VGFSWGGGGGVVVALRVWVRFFGVRSGGRCA